MPLYEYECESCGHRFEIIQQKFSDSPPEACPKCGKGPVQRLQSSPAIQFKGSGWYVTDYASKSKGGEGDSKPAASTTESSSPKGESGGSSESKKSDAPAATPATPSKPSAPKD